MSTTITLQKGLFIDGVAQLEAEVREPIARDILEATQEGERLMHTEQGPVLVTSSSAVGFGVLRRQIVRIGEVEGPLSEQELGKLSATDLRLLEHAAEQLDSAASEVALRGRSSTDGAASGEGAADA